MPYLRQSTYPGPPFYQFNGHLQTILAAFRQVDLSYERERIDLADGDFLDLDWVDRGSRKLVVLSHGLEGSSDRYYMKGMARIFAEQGWDVLAWNCRSCSGELNRCRRLYHHGEIEDISIVVDHALRTKDYTDITLIGFSMGGSITLKYLGSRPEDVPDAVSRGIAFSTPCNIEASARALEQPGNWLYRNRFLKSLRVKVEAKAAQFPDLVDLSAFDRIRVWRDFDEYFSAPMNGFSSAAEFYHQASAENFMADIRVPVLLVNAWNDPILPPDCTPVELCVQHPTIFLETPDAGGHVGFALSRREHTWSEIRSLEFVHTQLRA